MQYEAVDVESWDQAERLKFEVPPVEAGDYEEQLHVRTTMSNRFPFKALYVEVRQQWPDSLYVDTLCCDIDDATSSNTGISVRQYSFPIRRLSLAKGDSAVVCIRHIMRQEEISGISDIGVSLVRE